MTIRQFEAPSHECNQTLARFTGKNDWLDGTGSDIVLRLKIEIRQVHPDMKSLGDSLFIRTSAVAATHGFGFSCSRLREVRARPSAEDVAREAGGLAYYCAGVGLGV